MSNSTEDGPHCSTSDDTGSVAKTLDAALLNGHLEWLLQVGFSANMILEWAREKQVDDVDNSIPIPDPESEPQASQLSSFHESSYDNDEGQSQLDDFDDSIPIPDPEPEPQDSQLHDSSYDNDEGQSHSQEFESQSTRGTLDVAAGNARKRKHRHHHKSSAVRAKKQRSANGSLFRGATTNRQKKVQMRHLMLKILSKLEKLPEAANFITFDKADDYDDVVDYPMSIGEIKNRIGITRCECDSREQFCAEFDAIIEGCHKYYHDDPVRKDEASRLKVKFDELVKKYLPDDSHIQPLEGGLPSLEDDSDEEEAQRGSGSSSSSDSEEEVADDDSEEMGSCSYSNMNDTIRY